MHCASARAIFPLERPSLKVRGSAYSRTAPSVAWTRTTLPEIVKSRGLPVTSTNVSIPDCEQLAHHSVTQPFVLGARL